MTRFFSMIQAPLIASLVIFSVPSASAQEDAPVSFLPSLRKCSVPAFLGLTAPQQASCTKYTNDRLTLQKTDYDALTRAQAASKDLSILKNSLAEFDSGTSFVSPEIYIQVRREFEAESPAVTSLTEETLKINGLLYGIMDRDNPVEIHDVAQKIRAAGIQN